jgi:hypothetical protein
MKLFGIGSKIVVFTEGSGNSEYTCTRFVKLRGEWHANVMNDTMSLLLTLSEVESLL